MQFVIYSPSILASALQYALKSVLSVPALCIEMSTEGPHRVTMDGKTFRGLQTFLHALRRIAVTPEQRAFLGEDEEQVALVNQWVCAAAVLDVDAVRAGADPTASVAKALFSDVEHILVAMSNTTSLYLTGSERATIADVLMYAAVFNHSPQVEVLPATMKWAAHAQEDAYLCPIRSSAVGVQVEKKSSTASGGGAARGGAKAEAVYVKPSDEEILRRRAEKEKAKAEKAAAAATAAAAPAAAAAADPKKASASSHTGAPDSKKAKKAELDPACIHVRVGQLTNVRRHPSADRLYVEDMVLGDETRIIVSGLVGHYAIDELEGAQCLVVCNMKPKPLVGVTSHGMVLCAKKDAEVKLISPPAGAKPGDRVVFGSSFDAALAANAPEVISANRMSELLSHLHTDADGVLCWKELPAKHSSGVVVSIASMPNCLVS
ncbi:hypothetical protein JKF63_04375 [Porcisia hertigi]|uniref:tRNA-binding domain-containing protein n=1 Tax=Porcisia hertigi TaxID=2761500 RepID=A0A836I4K4_9TRYP|nr:hypothetical protein JKF63_04375 [Porcisia hertigi]